jgi:hypothetical protein
VLAKTRKNKQMVVVVWNEELELGHRGYRGEDIADEIYKLGVRNRYGL